jgi:spermidine synthase
MTPTIRRSIFSFCVYLAFFVSGAGCLVAEVTWNRMLIVVVGNSLSAAAMIIAVFMGGLGAGSFVGGRWISRRKASLLPYVVLELSIGLFVLLSPAIFDLLAGMFTSLAESVDNQAGLTLVRMVVSLIALFVPAFAMGATFPAMVSGAAPGTAEHGSVRTAYLYAVNTLGAAIGCFAAGYHLLFEFGVRTTLTVGFCLYIVASLSALVARSVARSGSGGKAMAAEDALDDAGQRAGRLQRRFLYAATCGIGFVALAYEVLLTRLSILYLGNSVSVFPLVLTGFLLGTGISAMAGTWLYGLLRRHNSGSYRLFGIIAVAAGAFILLTPFLLLTDWVLGAEQFARFADSARRNPLPILGLITAPTVLIGALLPLAIRMFRPEDAAGTTRDAATLYALNTAGGLIGAAVANHFLVPWIGMKGTLVCLAGICALAGLANLFGTAARPARWPVPVLGAGGVVVALVLLMPDMMHLYADKIAESTRAEKAEVQLVLEGRAATVTVIDQTDPRRGTYRDMYLNGVEEASTRYWHTQLFKLLGILPVMVHSSEAPKDALVIAFGAGITAGSVLACDDVASLDVVDLNPDIEAINDLFTDVNGDVYHQPRFHFHNNDGRNYLVTTHKKYDLIIGDSTHPRAYDSWILYTEEFYRSAKKRLKPGGVFAQWVPVHGSMQGELMRIHLNTFRRVFPNCTFWYVYGSDQAFFMSTPQPLSIDPDELQARLDRLPEWFRSDYYQLDTVAHVAGHFWMDEAAMQRMAAPETRINTDDLHYFDKQSALPPLPPRFRLPSYQTDFKRLLSGHDEALAAAIDREQQVAQLVAQYGFFLDRDALYRAYCTMPDNGNVHYFMSLETAGKLPDPSSFCAEQQIRTYQAMVAQHPGNAVALNGLADAFTQAGRLEEALPVARRAVDIEPENGMILDTLGWILYLQEKTDEALAVLEKANRHLPDHPIVLYHLGAARLAAGEAVAGRETLRRALEASADFPGAEEARRLLDGKR